MWRFYLIATIIVVAIGSAVFARRFVTRDWNVESRPNPRQTATITRAGGDAHPTTPPTFVGEGTWVMSALPGCFEQQSSKIGPSTLLSGEIPPAGERLAPTTLERGDCRIVVREHDIWVYRGDDRLRVPPEAHLYRHGDRLTLVWQHAGRTEIRVY
jgi:hypothetical protein